MGFSESFYADNGALWYADKSVIGVTYNGMRHEFEYAHKTWISLRDSRSSNGVGRIQASYAALGILSGRGSLHPCHPEHLLFSDSSKSGWLRPLHISYLEADRLPFLWDDHGGMALVSPRDPSIKIVELCADPGSSYGPWRILRCFPDNQPSRIVGGNFNSRYELGNRTGYMKETMAIADQMVADGAPSPLPNWSSNGTMTLTLPGDYVGVVRESAHTDDDGNFTLDYSVVAYPFYDPSDQYLINLRESLHDAIKLRDDVCFLSQKINEAKKDQAMREKRLIEMRQRRLAG